MKAMKMLFNMDDQVHYFKVTGEISPNDLSVLRQSLFRFFETQPEYVILDLSEISLQIPDFELQNTLTEIRTLASSKGLNFTISQTDIESQVAKQTVLENALLRQVEVLRNRVEIREEMKRNLAEIIRQNETLKATIAKQSEDLKLSPSTGMSPFNPLIEKLWSEK